jgi:mRNA-degrading endonuclease RelE of RelBE toxin-antitoxin system
MSFSVFPSDKFKKEAKRLSRKYPSLKEELAELNDTLTHKPETGIPLSNDTYKNRLAIKSKRKERC